METVLIILAAAAFAVGAGAAFVSFFRPGAVGPRRGLIAACVGAAFLLGSLLWHMARTRNVHVFGGFESLMLYALALAATYLYMAVRHDMRGLSLMIVPFLMVVAVVASIASARSTPIDPSLAGVWLNLHIFTAILGYALFTLAGVLAIGYLIQDRNLKRKRFGAIYERLPPLETLDHLMGGQIRFAFVVFTVSILVGVVLAHQSGWSWRWLIDPKIVATALTWGVYAVLFYLRTSAAYHGRKAAFVTIVGFVCVLVAVAGVRLITESMHEFARPSVEVTAT